MRHNNTINNIYLHVFNVIIIDENTLPVGILKPEFLPEEVDEYDVFFMGTRKEFWIKGFPRLERLPDELVVQL